MPTLWFLKDGRTSYAESGTGTPLSFDEAVAVFGTEDMRYLGSKAPNIGVDRESDDVRNTVLEVEEMEGTNPLLPRPGFYWATSLDPGDAERRLRKERDRH